MILAKSCIAFGPFFGVSFGCKPLIVKNLRHSPPLRGPQNNSFYFRVVLNQIDYSSLPPKITPLLSENSIIPPRHFPRCRSPLAPLRHSYYHQIAKHLPTIIIRTTHYLVKRCRELIFYIVNYLSPTRQS
jgi:hypothetical protein